MGKSQWKKYLIFTTTKNFFFHKESTNINFTLGLPEGITSIVHLCCGYPTYVDQNDYMKADKTLYIKLVSKKKFKI